MSIVGVLTLATGRLISTASLSWHEPFNPKLPCLAEPSVNSDPTKPFPYSFSDDNPYLEHIDVARAAKAARMFLSKQQAAEEAGGNELEDKAPPAWWSPAPRPREREPSQAAHHPTGGFANLVTQLVERAREEKARALGVPYHPPTTVASTSDETPPAAPFGSNLAATASEQSVPSTMVDSLVQGSSDTASSPIPEPASPSQSTSLFSCLTCSHQLIPLRSSRLAQRRRQSKCPTPCSLQVAQRWSSIED